MKLSFLSNLFKKSDAMTREKAINTKNNKVEEDDVKMLIENGKLKVNKRNYREAINDFTVAIKLDRENISAYFERSKAKKALDDKFGANEDLETGKRILDNLDRGFKANDSGNDAYEKGDYKNAIKYYNKAIPLVPTLTSIYYYRGCAKEYLGDYTDAIIDFNKSIEVNASNKDLSYYNRGKIKSHELDDKKGALEDLNKAIQLNSSDPDFYYSRAILLDDYDAINDLNRAIELDPTDADFYVARSLRKKAMEDLEGCIVDLTIYIQLKPEDGLMSISEAYTLRSGIKMLQNNLEDAIKDYDNAFEIEPFNETILLERGVAKDLSNDFKGAVIDLDKAIKLNPKYAEAYYHRGLIKQKIGLDDEGIMDVIKAKTLGFNE